jgi:hypothetical protein
MAVIATKLNVKNGGDARLTDLEVDTLIVNGVSVVTAVLLASGQVVDLNGEADGLVLDADADTSISSPTDDQIDIEVNGADDFRITANTFTALSGSTIATNTIAETTAASGVTIDGVLLKDGGAVFADAATIEIDTINEATAAAGVTIDSVRLKDGVVKSVPVTVTADGAIAVPPGDTTYFITKAGVAAMTLVAPTATTHDGIRLTFISTTAQAHTLDLASSGINGGAADIGTFGGAAGDGVTIVAYQAHWYEVPSGNVNVTWA